MLEAPPVLPERRRALDEVESKAFLGAAGIVLPESRVVPASKVTSAARALGYPVVLKCVDAAIAHKSEAGAVMLGLDDDTALAAALETMRVRLPGSGRRFLVERQVDGAVAEMIVGVRYDSTFGHALLVGAGGVLVELIEDRHILLLPTTRAAIESAVDSLHSYNPHVRVVTHAAPLTSENAMEILADYEIVVNGADNFATRYLVNDAAYLSGKTLVDGSILLFDGQATVYTPGQGCYRCLYPAPPPPGLVPSCAEAGVLGAITGVVGSIQATEVFKQVLGIGEPLVGRLLLIDALTMEFRMMRLRRDPACPLCGDEPSIHELIDYDQFCGTPPLVVSEEVDGVLVESREGVHA